MSSSGQGVVGRPELELLVVCVRPAFLMQRGRLDRRGSSSEAGLPCCLPSSWAVGVRVRVSSPGAEIGPAGEPRAQCDAAAGRPSLPTSQTQTAALPCSEAKRRRRAE